MPHRQVGPLVDALERVLGRHVAQLPERWRLERYVSQNYMGLFVEESQASLLKTLTAQLARELARLSEYGRGRAGQVSGIHVLGGCHS